MFFRSRKIFAGLIAVVFVFTFVFSFIFSVEPTHAQMAVSDPATVVMAAQMKLQAAQAKVQTGLKTAIVNAVVRAVDYFVRKIAYDTAVYIASGGKGQGTLAHTKNFGSYLSDVANDAAGTAIEQLGKPFGLNLCKIPDVRMDLALRLGLKFQYAPPAKPSCTFTDFTKNWSGDSWKSQYSGQALENRFNSSFQVSQSDIGLAMSASQKIDNMVAQESAAAVLQRQEGQGFKPSTKPISGGITSPAAANKDVGLSNTPDKKIAASQQSTMATLGTGLEGSMMGAAKLFLNTLAGTMLKNYMEKGMLPFGLGCVGSSCPQAGVLSNYDAEYTGGIAAAQDMFSSLLVPQNVEVNDYDTLSNFSNCPENPGPENCVADGGLVQAAQQSGFGSPITISEALKKDWLHGSYKLIPPERTSDNSSKSCYNSAYCFANIAKLRKARILPLGFEIAAIYSNPDKPWTLQQVVDGFNDCTYIKDSKGNIVGVQNDPINKPFCHLIDPNWVLKAPSSRCNVMGYGPSLADSSGPNRQQECLDLSTCVAYDSKGSCAISGYCTREKNSWNVDGQTCDAQYRTCKTFQDSTGNTVSYLYRTLDTGYCDMNNIGCTAYSLRKDYKTVASGVWAGYLRDDLVSGDQNSVVYFNHNLSSSCSVDSAGCSRFVVASSTSNQVTDLKKAPYYAQCYDADLNTVKIDWPQTQADLAKLKPTPECSNYAQACTPDEVNCNWYTPITYGGDKIPGRFTPATQDSSGITWNDQCDASCVGYAAYREMANNYSNGQSIAYIIPSSGSKCSSQEESCTGFTNLGTTVGGLEKVEYYTSLRSCITPDEKLQKKFYTYEGSANGGYQLKAFVLEKDAEGGPKYFYKTQADKNEYEIKCNESLYKTGKSEYDCRQFNDDQGNVYYRKLSKTVVVSDQCTPYRLDNPELYADTSGVADEQTCTNAKGYWDTSSSQCKFCFQDGEYRNGECFYMGLAAGTYTNAGSSISCSASASSCHAYKGNAGNNIQSVFTDDFDQADSTDVVGWYAGGGAAAISSESALVNGRSLSYSGDVNENVYKNNLDLKPGESYDLTFWAKGSANSVSVLMDNSASPPSSLGNVGISDTWQYYHLGPVFLSGTNTSTNLKFVLGDRGTIFLDNVHLTEVSDYIYLVKNTLSVNSVCDSHPEDNLPGEALGCSEYQNANGKSIDLTGFSYLCREGAIGCTALFDTFNTPSDPSGKVYNVWMAGLPGQNIDTTVNGQKYNCQIQQDRNGCYINVTGATIDDIKNQIGLNAIATSTVYVPPDTSSAEPIYLVANEAASCLSVDLGCVNAGQITQSTSSQIYSDVLIKNDPASYDSILCKNEAVGCDAFSDGNSTMYFKDPKTIGQRICSYATNITVNGVKSSGWFWKGVGDGTEPCYPNYLKSGSVYDMWSFGVQDKYQNFVGECPAEQNNCTEFVDHHDGDKPYYVINNDEFSKKLSACNGEISEKEGCVLFDQTDQPNKVFDTEASYKDSKSHSDALVKPASTNSDDANVIIKVTRDRTCGEWLQCRSSHRVWDQSKGAYKEVCDLIGRCDQLPESFTDSNITNCAHWIDGVGPYSDQVLTDTLYRNRDTSWKGMDFSGYSLLDTYPIEELSQVNFGQGKNSQDWRMVKEIPCGEVQYCQDGAKLDSVLCKPSQDKCGRGGVGSCQKTGSNYVCVQNPDGSTADIFGTSPNQTCRAYPEETSPYPNSQKVKTSQVFAGANSCNESGSGVTTDSDAANSCECDYTKVEYGTSVVTKYWNFTNPNGLIGIPNKTGAMAKGIVGGICSGGNNGGRACETDTDCPSGTCEKATKQTNYIGWHGYCLESDKSRHLNANEDKFSCLTWYPVDTINGAPDVNGQNQEAGYVTPASGGKYYCLQSNQLTGVTGGTNYYYDLLTRQNLSVRTDIANCASRFDPTTGSGFCEDVSEKSARLFALPNSLESNLKLQDIEKITFTVTAKDSEDPVVNTVFEIWPNDNTASPGTPQAVFKTKSDKNSPGHVVVGKYLGKSNEFILMYSSGTKTNSNPDVDTYLRDDGSVCFPFDCHQLQGNILHDLSTTVNGAVAPLGPEGLWNVDFGNDNLFNCEAGAKDAAGNDTTGSGNWHAIRLQFDPSTGVFKGYYMAYCDASDKDGLVSYKVRFTLRGWCSVYADASMGIEGNNGTFTAPWTDRLWLNSRYDIPNLNDTTITTGTQKFNYTQNHAAFGSISQNTQPLDPILFTPPRTMPKDSGECNPCPLIGGQPDSDCACTFTLTKPIAVSGFPYLCFGDGSGMCARTLDSGTVVIHNTSVTGKHSLIGAQEALGNIFANVKDIYRYNSATGYSTTTGSSYNFTNRTETGDKGICQTRISIPDPTTGLYTTSYTNCPDHLPTPPVVLALDKCLSGKCLESSAPGITVNDKSAGDVVSPAYVLPVNVKFYAYANQNQMPIKNIIVVWGDGDLTNLSGYYRNHRGDGSGTCVNKTCHIDSQKWEPGLFANNYSSKSLDTGKSCTKDTDCKYLDQCFAESKAMNFGQIQDKTCDNSYFRFDHVYQCLKDGTGWQAGDKCPNDQLKDQYGGCCVFRPSVQVKDNWGWCNGVCPEPDNGSTDPATSPGGTGCYDKSWNAGPPKSLNECNTWLSTTASTSFSGNIIIAPQ